MFPRVHEGIPSSFPLGYDFIAQSLFLVLFELEFSKREKVSWVELF
jgi:hypothetical protein